MALPAWVPGGSRILLQAPGTGAWSASELCAHVDDVASALCRRQPEPRRVGILADNSPHWVVIDMATQCAGYTLVPLPHFFSPSQLTHIVRAAALDVLFCADPEQAASLGFRAEIAGAAGLRMFDRTDSVERVESGSPGEPIQKITFTSGTTGAPKGVCLTAAQQLAAARALAEAMGPLGITRHLNLLPLSILLENVAGIYTSILIGARCVCPPLAQVGLPGASGFDAERCLGAIAQYAPESMILLPRMLQALVAKLDPAGDPRIQSLKFVAVGGAKTPASLIGRARELGLPVYEGYGLSECASVVALNVPGADKPGTVGRPLPGTHVRVAADGELEVSGRGFSNYLGAPRSSARPWLKTGDLGSRDADGFICITGRKKDILITSFGRNISPEWPEGLLLESPLVAQAAVFGDARPHLVAILVASRQVDDGALDRIVAETNRRLPGYARILAWMRASEPFTPHNGLATPNDRIRRDAIGTRYADRLNDLYQTQSQIP